MRDGSEVHQTVEAHDFAGTLAHEPATILESDRLRKMRRRSMLKPGYQQAMVPI